MQQLIALECALHSPEYRRDGAAVTQLLHPQFQEVGASGNSYDLQSIISMMAAEDISQWRVHSQDFECKKLAEDICLLLYKSCMVQDGEQPRDFAKRSSVWVRQNDNWQIQYHQGTPCDAFTLTFTQ